MHLLRAVHHLDDDLDLIRRLLLFGADEQLRPNPFDVKLVVAIYRALATELLQNPVADLDQSIG